MSIFVYLKLVFSTTGFHTTRKRGYLGNLQQFIAVFLVFAVTLGVFPVSVQAASFSGVEEVRSHQKITLKPNAAITYTIKFKNTGTSTWSNSGANFVAAATTPNLRTSAYAHIFWEEPYRAGRLIEEQVAPGEVGTFRFALQAPVAEGEYAETFQLVARNRAWIEGTEFTIPLSVKASIPKPVVQEAPEEDTSSENRTSIPVDYPVKDSAYSADWVNGDEQSFVFNPGEQKLLSFDVKNTGAKTWVNAGYRNIAAYTVRPNYHDSLFATNGPGWISPSHIRLGTPEVAPGEVGKVTVMLEAPKTSGTYTQHIRLGVDDYSWVQSGELAISIRVNGTIIPKEESKETSDQQEKEAEVYIRDIDYAAKYLVQSHSSLTLKPGSSLDFQVGFKNVGTKNWNQTGARFVSLYTTDPNYRSSRFSTGSNNGWISTKQIQLEQSLVEPGRIGYFKFRLTAPTTPGVYTEKFRLAAEDYTWIQGGELTLSILVEGSNQQGDIPSEEDQVIDELLGPMMRVGLYHSEETFEITTDSPFEVRTGSGSLLGSLPARTPVQVRYDASTNLYTVTSSSINRTLSDYVIIQALDTQTISEILSLEKRVPWNQAINENTFRGSIEIRHSEATGDTWAINVLPMEHYLRGIAETSSSSPVEFLKVMSVAARTYGMYHYERQTKHATKHFYVDSEFDQVYRGYSLEQRHPGLVEAVKATTGEVVEYDNDLAITPYFSQSDGRTRDWSEVWGGVVEWCRSVSVPHDVGKQLLGHGVGMSARGGLLMVHEDGLNYQQVLKYFFSGVIIDDRY